jgi:hypothetical protein
MNTHNSESGYEPKKRRGLFFFGAIAIAVSSALAVGCFPSDPDEDDGDGDGIDLVDPNPSTDVSGTMLYCDPDRTIQVSTTAANYAVDGPDSIPSYNVSREEANITSEQSSELRASAGNNIKRLSSIVDPMDGSGTIITDTWEGEPMVHPILVSYTEQVLGDYEMGDGSADIGDPDNIDDPFVSVSLDNGKSWKKQRISDSSGSSSTQVTWDSVLIDYPGHSHKMTMGVKGNNILVAWLDKYCPSGNPYDLEDPATEDLYQVNGSQGSIDYNLPCTIADPESNEFNCAPNGKAVYEVPFSCVWAARGVFDAEPSSDTYGQIEWRKPEQLTSGTRDANKLWIAAETVDDGAGNIIDGGFAISWQEDPEGLRAGKGEGPGVGWSGATTNHGADIWYTYITMADFIAVEDPDAETKLDPSVMFTYPVRVTDNEACFFENDTKLYCEQVCTDSTTVNSNNSKDQDIVRCLTGDIDPLPQWNADETELVEGAYAALDGDTGASRPAIKILRTNENELITILGYEETKGLSTSEPGEPEDPDAVEPTDIAYEGKVVLFESFPWNDPNTISAGDIVNLKVPPLSVDADDNYTYNEGAAEEDWYYENARRLVIINQVDACEMTENSYPFGFMYKQSFETQGGASDMYIRMNTGFTYEDFEDTVTNVSGQSLLDSTATPTVDNLVWSEDNLLDYPAENPYDNTFSPRAFMRGDEIYTGFAYTPSGDRTENGMEASNFWIHRYVDDGEGAGLTWNGPQQVSFEQGGTSALDPRLTATPPYNAAGVAAGLLSDMSNPNVILMSYGTADADHELDILYSRSTDKGKTFEYYYISGEEPFDPEEDQVRFHYVSKWPLPVEEKEVQLIASPDGNMGFNVWLQESDVAPDGNDLEVDGVTIPANRLGLESWLGRVDWTDPVTHEVTP